jgi:hypothetical protein
MLLEYPYRHLVDVLFSTVEWFMMVVRFLLPYEASRTKLIHLWSGFSRRVLPTTIRRINGLDLCVIVGQHERCLEYIACLGPGSSLFTFRDHPV